MQLSDGIELVEKVLDPIKRETYTQLAAQLDKKTRLLIHLKDLKSSIQRLKDDSVFVMSGTAVWLGLLDDKSIVSGFPDIWYWQPQRTSLLLEPPVIPTSSVPALDLNLV